MNDVFVCLSVGLCVCVCIGVLALLTYQYLSCKVSMSVILCSLDHIRKPLLLSLVVCSDAAM